MGSKTPENKDQKNVVYDVIVIGGNLAGLNAASYAKQRNLSTLVIDKTFSDEKYQETTVAVNYPLFPLKIKREELYSLVLKQAKKLGVEIAQERIISIYSEKEVKILTTTEGMYLARTLILATKPKGRTPTIKGEELLKNKGVSYCATCDAPFFKGKDVIVFGKYRDIFHEIGFISQYADFVTVVISTPRLTLEKQERLTKFHVAVLPGYRVIEILGTNSVEGVIIRKSHGKKKRQLKATGIFIYPGARKTHFGFRFDSIETTSGGCVKVDKNTMSTSIPGVYATGEITCQHFNQPLLSAGDGVLAALSAEEYINSI